MFNLNPNPFLGAGIVACDQDSFKQAPAKKQSEAANQKLLWIQPPQPTEGVI
jgi:hypothetical protein